MILVDTSVWIDHFHHSDPVLVSLLHEDEIGSHPLVAEELAMGGHSGPEMTFSST